MTLSESESLKVNYRTLQVFFALDRRPTLDELVAVGRASKFLEEFFPMDRLPTWLELMKKAHELSQLKDETS